MAPRMTPAYWARAALALAALAVSLLGAGPARAAEAPTHELLYSIHGEVINRVPIPPPEGEIEDACGVALDSAGDVYASDYYHHVIDVYGPGSESEPGPYLTQIPVPGPDGPCNLAVDSAGDVYANRWRGGVLELTPSEYPLGEEITYSPATAIDPTHITRATGLATDPAGDLYVEEGTQIAFYEAPVKATSEAAAEIGAGTLGQGYGLARSAYPATEGDLYAPDAATDTVKVYDPKEPAAPIAEIDGAGVPGGGFGSLIDSAVALDPSDGHLFVAENTEPGEERPAAAVDEFNAAGAYRGRLGEEIIDAEPSALTVDGKGWVYATSGNTEGSAVDVFGPTEAAHTLKVKESGTGAAVVASEPAGIRCPGACAAEYNAGTEVFLTAIPGAHSAFAGWAGCLRTAGARCTVLLSADRSPTATFDALPQKTLTLAKAGSGAGTVGSEPAGIDCSLACFGEEASFNEGSKVTLTAAAPLGSVFSGWSGDCSGTGACEVTMSAARSLSASFQAVPIHTLAVGTEGAGGVAFQPAGISCGEACSAQLNQGTEVTLTATPAPGWRFAGFSGGGCSGTAPCQLTLAADTAVEATFVPVLRTLTIAASGTGAGAVSSQPAGISCGGACSAQFDEGTEVTLSATPAPGSRFAGWAGGGCSGTGACHLTLEADTEVSAGFTLARPTLSVVRSGTGQGTVGSEPAGGIECGTRCAAVLDRGTTVTLLAHALPGSAFAGWGGCEAAAGERCTVRMDDDRTLTASFVAKRPPNKHHHHRKHRRKHHRHRKGGRR